MNRAARDSNLVTQKWFVHYQHPLWYPLGETEENEEPHVTVAYVIVTIQIFTSPKVELVTAMLTFSRLMTYIYIYI